MVRRHHEGVANVELDALAVEDGDRATGERDEISSRSTVCSTAGAPGGKRRRQTLLSRDPRLGAASPVTKMPWTLKVGAVVARMTGMVFSGEGDMFYLR